MHPRFLLGHRSVSESEMCNFLQVRVNQGIAWRYTRVRRTIDFTALPAFGVLTLKLQKRDILGRKRVIDSASPPIRSISALGFMNQTPTGAAVSGEYFQAAGMSSVRRREAAVRDNAGFNDSAEIPDRMPRCRPNIYDISGTDRFLFGTTGSRRLGKARQG